MLRIVSALGLAVLLAGGAYAGVPQQINHQGVVRVGGVPFTGTGLFKFAIVDPDLDLPDGRNLWTNDGVNQGTTGDPTAAVSISVVGGVYTVALGDTDLIPPGSMTVIPSTVFNDDNAELRIWFEDDQGTGMQLLTPNHKLTTAPYSYRLPSIYTADDGKVGIGENDPQGRLEIRSAGPSSAPFLVRNSVVGHDLRLDIQGDNRPWFRMYQNGVEKIRLDVGAPSFFVNGAEIGTNVTSNALLNVGSDSFTSSIRVNSNTSSGATPLVDIVSTVHAVSDILFNITGDSDTDAGGPWTAFQVTADGSIFGRTGLLHAPSDARLKRNIATIPDALKRVLALRGVNFKWKDAHLDGDSVQIGLIAQEVAKVFPEAVQTSKDKMGTMAVEYEHLIGALVEAIKELDGIVKQKDAELEAQGRRIGTVESRLAAIEARLPKVAQAHRRD